MKKLVGYKNLSIGRKFTVTFLLFLMIPMLLLLLWINSNFTQKIREENCKTNLAILKQTETGLENMIQDVTSVSLDIIGNEELQMYLKKGNLEEKQMENLKNSVQYDLGKTTDLKNYISRLSVFDETGILMQSGKYMLEESQKYINEIRQAAGKMVWTSAGKDENYLLNRDKNIYEVSIYRALNNYEDYREILAYERITIAEDYICDLYAGIANEYTKELFVVTKEGEVISSVNKDLLGMNLKDEISGSEIVKNVSGYYMNNQDKTIVSYYRLPKVSWYVIKVDEQAAVIEQNLIRTIVLICMALAVVFGIIFYKIQKKRIIEPIITLAKDVSCFQEGQYEIGTYSDAKDEIAVLNNNFIEMGKYIQNLIESVYKSQIREKEAQLQCLQSQINPHFLYNTLDSMRWMAVKKQQYDLAEQIEALSSLFKHALNQGKNITTIGQEIQHLRDYMTIQNNRFGDRIKTEISVEADLENCRVLNLILQPLVENAIVHGLEEKLGNGCIKVDIRKDGSDVIYTVEDDGMGTDQEKIRMLMKERTDSHNVLALDNIDQRIKCKFGEEYGISFFSEIGIGTKVEVKMPLDCEEEDEIINRR